jgi:Concanavalin A-like lectin/glucanases superfamily
MISTIGRVGRSLESCRRRPTASLWTAFVGLCGIVGSLDCGSSQSGGPLDSGAGGSADSGGSTSSSSSGGGSSGSSGGASSGGSSGAGSSGGSGSGGGDDGGPLSDAAGDGAGSSGDGSTSCAGGAISFNLNVGTGADPAMQRVMVDFGTSADLPIGASLRTVEFWAFALASTWRGDSNTVFEYGTVTTNGGFGFDWGTAQQPTMGTIDPYTNGSFDNDNQPSGITNPNVNQWIHIAMTWDGTAVRAFVNGMEKSTKTSAGNMLATARTQLSIGGNPRGAYFNGYLDEFRIWNIARTAADIQSTMNKTLAGNETGLVGYWKFDETSGTTAADSTMTTGHTAHNGTLMSAATFALPVWIPSTAPINCP